MSARTPSGAARDLLPHLLLDPEDIVELLDEFTATLARRPAPEGTDVWCGVTLLRAREGTTVASSSPEAGALDETQNRFRNCPCLTAIREHTVVRVGDVAADSRWAVSSHRNTKLRDVAAELVATVGTGPATTHFDT